jgi:predicted glycosyltransferase
VRYLGYLDRAPGAGSSPSRAGVALGFPDPSRPHLVCLVGGGGDGYPLANTFLEALALPPERWNGTLVTGPFLSRERRNRLVSRSGPQRNVQMIRFTAHIEELLGSADLLVSMGGYNAMLEAVAFRKRTVIVPRVFPRREQWLRAAAFERLGLVHSVEPGSSRGRRGRAPSRWLRELRERGGRGLRPAVRTQKGRERCPGHPPGSLRPPRDPIAPVARRCASPTS